MRNVILKLTCSVIFKRTGMMVRFENVEDTSMQELRTILIDAFGMGGKTICLKEPIHFREQLGVLR